MATPNVPAGEKVEQVGPDGHRRHEKLARDGHEEENRRGDERARFDQRRWRQDGQREDGVAKQDEVLEVVDAPSPVPQGRDAVEDVKRRLQAGDVVGGLRPRVRLDLLQAHPGLATRSVFRRDGIEVAEREDGGPGEGQVELRLCLRERGGEFLHGGRRRGSMMGERENSRRWSLLRRGRKRARGVGGSEEGCDGRTTRIRGAELLRSLHTHVRREGFGGLMREVDG